MLDDEGSCAGFVIALVAVVAVMGVGYWIVTPRRAAACSIAWPAHSAERAVRASKAASGALRVNHRGRSSDFYVRVEDVEMETSFTSPFRGSLLVRKLYARSVEVRTAGAAGAARAPLSFAPPYPIRLEDGRIGTFTQGPISRKTEDLVLRDIVLKGEGDKKSWRVEKAAVVTQYGAASLAGTLGNEKPYALDLTVGFEGKVQGQDLRVTAKAGGTLAKIEARAEALIAGARAGARATMEPFDAIPVKSVEIDASGVDISRFVEGMPTTRLGVSARISSPQSGVFAGPVHITNADPGP
jgi:translocation and assembly module TamB